MMLEWVQPGALAMAVIILNAPLSESVHPITLSPGLG